MSEKLEKLLKRSIKTNGFLALEEFFTLVLYHEKLGYYSKNNIIGKTGDFITAPEISQTFGEMIANWITLNLNYLKIEKQFSLCELGPGRGTLMQDITNTIMKLDIFLHKKINNIFFFEKSPKFRPILKKKFPGHILVEDPERFPKNFNIIIANEFFDAIPINQYIYRNKCWYKKVVTLDENNNFCFQLSRNLIPSSLLFPKNVKDGFVFEYSEYFFNLANSLFKNIKSYGGIMLIIDYAKKKEEADGTIFSIKGHKYKNIMQELGSSDISFKPDFQILKKIATMNNCFSIGPVNQSFFLQKLGINERFNILINHNPDKKISLLSQKERLISHKQMGKDFKVLAVVHKEINVKYGFE